MSKMDDLRALREARYERTLAAAAAKGAGARKAAPETMASPRKSSAAMPPAASPSSEQALCGHRAISGRTCTREQGHTAKNHRYSRVPSS